MNLIDYFDRISIIHLPERVDRLRALRAELVRAGIDIDSEKVFLPAAPVPIEANGFPSRGVYGNFLSHLEIIQSAYADHLDNVLVLEDDAIFRSWFKAKQASIVKALSHCDWDMCFIGHSVVTSGLPQSSTGFIKTSEPFKWAHCYAIHNRIMPRLIQYMTEIIDRPAGHPSGGKMYIDGTYNLFRQFNPDVVSLISHPRLSVQKGSQSSLNLAPWYDRNPITSLAVTAARMARDECWRRGWLE